MEEIPAMLAMIAHVRSEVKEQAFSVLENEVARYAKTEEEISEMIDALLVSRWPKMYVSSHFFKAACL